VLTWPEIQENKKSIREHAGGICQKCGAIQKEGDPVFELHRIMPGRAGGEYTQDNCVLLCPSCHRSLDTIDYETYPRKIRDDYSTQRGPRKQIMIRMSDEEHETIKRAAALAKRTFSDYVRIEMMELSERASPSPKP
jgi:hypothetical protein